MTGGSASGPAHCRELFLAFQSLALQGFGGVLPVAQRILVEQRQWLSRTEFLALMSLGQILPGPNIINMALIYGDRLFGWRGALAACGGLLAAPLVLVLTLALLVQQVAHFDWMHNALRGMGVVAAGLVLSTAFKLLTALKGNRMGWMACAVLLVLTVAAVAGFRWPLVGVLAVLAPAAWGFAWWSLRPSTDSAGGSPP